MTTNNAKTKIMKVIQASPDDFIDTTTETSVDTVLLNPPKPPKQSQSTANDSNSDDDTNVRNVNTTAHSTSYTVRGIRSARGNANSKQHHRRYQLHVSRVNMSMIIPVDPDDIDTEEIPACDRIKTDELPAVHIVHMPPRFKPHELYVRNGDAAEFLERNPDIRVKHYDPRDSVMTIDDNGNAITYRIGTRIIPLSEIALDKRYPCGALSRMDDNRRKGRIASSVGHNFLMESDDLPQGEITTYAKAF